MKQMQRMSVMNSFKSGRTSVLVATDVAARGIDVNGVDAVFNYDLPQDNEYYIHRIGRTGRAGKSGKAYTLLSGRKQLYSMKAVAKYTKSDITEGKLPSRSEVAEAKLADFAEKISSACQKEVLPETDRLIELLNEKNITVEDIARALCSKRIGKDLKNIPDVQSLVYKPERNVRRNGNGKVVKVNINVGRNQKIAPNYILGALVDATGMSGKNFGKIDIHDKYTTVEVPGEESGFIIDSMNNSRINGNKVTVKLYEGKSFPDKNRNYSRKNNSENKGKDSSGVGNKYRRNSGSQKKRY